MIPTIFRLQIPQAYGVSPRLAQTAYDAANLMDRFPVADVDDSTVVDVNVNSAVGAITGAGVGFGEIDRITQVCNSM